MHTAAPNPQIFPADLKNLLHAYLDQPAIETIRSACLFGAEAHAGQTRLSGEPFISHPLQVAKTMAELQLDADTITAGILHDVLEDTPVTKEALAKKFGQAVADIVDGVSKIDHLEHTNRQVAQAETFQKMMLAMTRDLRVILVKLADRLHNMRTITHTQQSQQQRVARETLEIFAPIARRIGMDTIRRQLEELCFATLHPRRYRVLSQAIEQRSQELKKACDKLVHDIGRQLGSAEIKHEIASRKKHLFSIYQKMKEKNIKLAEVMDIFAIRIIVDSVDDCYRSLGLVHSIYKPLPGRFKDYIAIPKMNGYQSLHTAVFAPNEDPIEVQIRSRDMDAVAQNGIAAHSAYKCDGDIGKQSILAAGRWLQSLTELKQQTGSSIDFFENVKTDLYADEVYVFTPQGQIKVLAKGATVLDFAFAVHTDVGLSCSSAQIDNRQVPLDTVLRNGQTIHIINSKIPHANPSWLNSAITAKARVAIRNHLKKMDDRQAIDFGRQLLQDAMQKLDHSLERITTKHLRSVAQQFGAAVKDNNSDYLFRQIGLGNQLPMVVARKLTGATGEEQAAADEHAAQKPLAIHGTEGMVVHYAKCCYPIPGDPIIGALHPGRGLTVHHARCHNLPSLELGNKMNLCWAATASQQEYHVAFRAVTTHRRGMLALIATRIADMHANIESIGFEERPGMMASINFTVSVHDLNQLNTIFDKIESASPDIQVARI